MVTTLTGNNTMAQKPQQRLCIFKSQLNDFQEKKLYDSYQVVPGTCRGGSFKKKTWFIEIHCDLERSEIERNEMNEMNELTRINFHE